MAQVIEQSNSAYEQRNKAQLEMAAIEQANRKEQEAFEQQMTELGRMIEDDLKLVPAKRSIAPGTNELLDTAKPTHKQISLIHANALREKAQQLKEQMLNFERAFNEIEAVTGIADVEELVWTYIANEEHNFSLFTYANEQANETKRLEELVQGLRDEESKCAQESGQDVDAHKRLVEGFKYKIDTNEKQIEKLQLKCDRDHAVLNTVKDGIQTLLLKLNCKSDIRGDISITETNMLYFLGIIEQRTNEILSTYYTLKSLEQSTLFDGTDDGFDGILPLSEHPAAPTTRSLSMGQHILGIGPTVPMGKEQISVNPPKLSDYSSDDGSVDGDRTSSTRPFTRDEIRSKTEVKAMQLKANGESNKASGGNAQRATMRGRRGNNTMKIGGNGTTVGIGSPLGRRGTMVTRAGDDRITLTRPPTAKS